MNKILYISPCFSRQKHCQEERIEAFNQASQDAKAHDLRIFVIAAVSNVEAHYASHLQKLYEENKDKGFVILGFPSNDFHQQEPGTDKEIKAFCTTHYHVTFPMFSKIVVKGNGQHPLYQYLTSKTTDPTFGGEIEWNFAKFLIGRSGEIVARFPAGMDPLKPEAVDAVKRELEKPK